MGWSELLNVALGLTVVGLSFMLRQARGRQQQQHIVIKFQRVKLGRYEDICGRIAKRPKNALL